MATAPDQELFSKVAKGVGVTAPVLKAAPMGPVTKGAQLDAAPPGPAGPTMQTMQAPPAVPLPGQPTGGAPPAIPLPGPGVTPPPAPGPSPNPGAQPSTPAGPITGAPTPSSPGALTPFTPGAAAPGAAPQAPGFPSLFDEPMQAQEAQVTDAMKVSTQLDSLLDKNNPLMVQARENAKRMMAGRGMQNSTMAGQAGEQALISSALPIAQQDAATAGQVELANQQAHNAFNMSSKEFAQNMEAAKQKFGFDSALSSQDAYQQLQKLAQEGNQQAKLALLNYGYERDLTVLQGNIAKDKANNDFANQMVLNAQQGDIESKQMLEKYGFDMNLSAADNLNRLQQIAAQGDVNAKLQLQQFNYESLLNAQKNGFDVKLEDQRFQNNQNLLISEYTQRGVLSEQEAKQQLDYLNQQHLNTLDQIKAQVAAQTSGDSAAAGRALQNNYLLAVADRQRAGSDEIARIYSTEGLKPEQQQTAARDAYNRMQQDLSVLRQYYQQSPMWDPSYGAPATPGTPGPSTGPPGPGTPRQPTAPTPGVPAPQPPGIPMVPPRDRGGGIR